MSARLSWLVSVPARGEPPGSALGQVEAVAIISIAMRAPESTYRRGDSVNPFMWLPDFVARVARYRSYRRSYPAAQRGEVWRYVR